VTSFRLIKLVPLPLCEHLGGGSGRRLGDRARGPSSEQIARHLFTLRALERPDNPGPGALATPPAGSDGLFFQGLGRKRDESGRGAAETARERKGEHFAGKVFTLRPERMGLETIVFTSHRTGAPAARRPKSGFSEPIQRVGGRKNSSLWERLFSQANDEDTRTCLISGLDQPSPTRADLEARR